MPAKRGDRRSRPRLRRFDVAVVGGGLIGLAVAWRAAARGLRGVRARPRRARPRHVARRRPGCSRRSRRPTRASRRSCASGSRAPGRGPPSPPSSRPQRHRRSTSARTARCSSPATATRPRRSTASSRCARRFGLRAERLLPSRARRAEPALAPTVRLALDVPDDHAVDPRLVVAALARAAERAGAVLRPHARGRRGAPRRGRRRGRRRRASRRARRPRRRAVVGVLPGVPEDARVPVRPVKGQSLRLRDPAGPGPASSASCAGTAATSSRAATGATSSARPIEERGFDTAMTGGGVHDLLRDASELVPGVLELEVEELIAGLRPGTPDNAPIVGASPRRAGPRLGDRPLPQRRAADAGHRRARRRRARRRGGRPGVLAARASRGWRRDLRQRRAARARGRDDRRAARRARRRGARPRRRGRRRRRGRPARRVGRAPRHRGRARRGALRRCREAE